MFHVEQESDGDHIPVMLPVEAEIVPRGTLRREIHSFGVFHVKHLASASRVC